MNASITIPNEFIILAITAIGSLTARIIVGMIARNKTDSDKADERLEKMIEEDNKERKEEIAKLLEKFTRNDKELYKEVASVREDHMYRKGLEDAKNVHN